MGRDQWRIVRRPIKYRALLSQKRFHRSRSRFKAFSGPVGSGKTQALCQEAIKLSYQNSGRTGLVGAPTYPMLRDATMTTYLEILEEAKLPFTLNKSTNTLTMDHNRSRVLFRALDEYERLRGPNLAWFGIDEMTYVPEEAWLRLEARLRDPKAERLCGFGVCTPKGFNWVHRKFIAEPVRGYALIEAEPFENKHLLAKTPDYYERLQASYDENFYQQEVLGKYLNLQAGQVYYAFDRQENIGDFEIKGDEPLLWAWDFNINPMCSVICQKWGSRVVALDEIVLRTSSTPEVCQEFLGRHGGHRAGVRIYGDASGNHGQTTTGSSDFQLIRQFLAKHNHLRGELVVAASNPPVRDRVNTVNAHLRNAQGERRLYLNRKCRELIQDFEQVCYKPDSGQIDKESDSRRTHLSDALGYLLWQECRPASPVGEQNRRLM